MPKPINYFIRFKQLSVNWLKIVFAAICLGVILLGIAYLSNRINCLDCPFRPKYQGIVIDKSLTSSESTLGSKINRRLLIQPEIGEKFEVVVTEVVFDKAKIGSQIKADEYKTEFSENKLP